MKAQFNLDITSPCSENYNGFKPTLNGGFCGSCEKEVIDFTTMNAQETIAFFETYSDKKTCGRFHSSQLKTYQHIPKKSKKLSFLSGIGLSFLSLFSFSTSQAQETKKQANTGEKDPSKIINQKHEKTMIVKGSVFDETGPLPGVSILLQGSKVGTQTDFDGNFKFPQQLKKGDVLVFSYVGFESRKVVISNKDSASKITLNIDMNMLTCVVVGKVAVKKVFTSNNN